MPKYSKKITCPTSATHAERTTTEIQVSTGIISQVSVTWSFGSNFLNALVVNYKKGQIIPSEGGGECRGNGDPDIWPEYIELDEQNPKLSIEVWNEGNDNEQDVLISIVILPKIPTWAEPIRELTELLRSVLGL